MEEQEKQKVTNPAAEIAESVQQPKEVDVLPTAILPSITVCRRTCNTAGTLLNEDTAVVVGYTLTEAYVVLTQIKKDWGLK